MTDQILVAVLLVMFAACVACAGFLRLRSVRNERNRRLRFRGVNRFKTAPRQTNYWSLN